MTSPFAEPPVLKPPAPRVVPEPPRPGEPGGAPCPACARPPDAGLWSDGRWRLAGLAETPYPGTCLLEPVVHADTVGDLPPGLQAEVGPMIARVQRALLDRGDVGRVIVSIFGDGIAHLHLWFVPRPLGALDQRGSGVWEWYDHLPPASPEEVERAHADLTARMRAGD